MNFGKTARRFAWLLISTSLIGMVGFVRTAAEAVALEAPPPYGWWQTKAPARSGDPPSQMDGRQGAGRGSQGGAKFQARPDPGGQPAGMGQTAAALPGGGRAGNHSFALNRSPTQSLYLAVSGAAPPTEAPEVYYRFTARTMERHGGVALGSSVHRAKVERDGETWRADFTATTFGTVEVFSRFVLDGRPIYSQANYLHFIRPEDAAGASPDQQAELPAEWPRFVFPVSGYNGMPLRTLAAEQRLTFELAAPADAFSSPPKGMALEASGEPPKALDWLPLEHKFAYIPADDPKLAEPGGRGSKQVALLADLPGGAVVFSLSVNRAKWTNRQLGGGLGLVFGAGALSFACVRSRRLRFKYNDRN